MISSHEGDFCSCKVVGVLVLSYSCIFLSRGSPFIYGFRMGGVIAIAAV